MNTPYVRLLCAVFLFFFVSQKAYSQNSQSGITRPIHLERAVALAQENDPWIQMASHRQSSLDAMAESAGRLPDPKLSVAMANLPTNTWDFDQEAMTQFKVGLSQNFPRGDELELKRQRFRQMSAQWPHERQQRLKQVRVRVSELWLSGYQAFHSIRLIEANRYLFEQMADITQSFYSSGFSSGSRSGLGRTRQQDVVRAQLELTKLEDRLTQLRLQQEQIAEQLAQWLLPPDAHSYAYGDLSPGQFSWPEQLPQLPVEFIAVETQGQQELVQLLSQHPSIKIFDQKIEASLSEKQLAQQKYKPEWGLNASYGYRDDDLMGNERADFFSVGVSLDLPFFGRHRQDNEVASAIQNTEALKTERWHALRNMLAAYQVHVKSQARLAQRQRLYQTQLLPQLQEQAEATLTAYTNDDGNFAEVMRARIAQLNGELDALAIAVDRLKHNVNLRYYHTTTLTQPTSTQVNTDE